MSTPVRVKISALGAYVPPRVLDNFDLEKMVETSNEWILERTGIRERHVADPGVGTSALAAEAARRALAERGIGAEEIELIIVCTITPDMLYPATACLVQDKLGAGRAWGFDLSAACSGFEYGLQTGAQFVASGAHRKVLVIGADVMSAVIDYQDRATCVLFGDGAGAVLLEPAGEEGLGIIDFLHEVDGSGGLYLCQPAGGSLAPASHITVDKRLHYVHQDGKQVFKFAVRKMAEASEAILERNGFSGSDVDCFIAHQANQRIIAAAAERLKMPWQRVVLNIDRYGNTTGATIPLAMETARQEGKVKKGDLVLLAAVGAGFTVGTSLLRWAM